VKLSGRSLVQCACSPEFDPQHDRKKRQRKRRENEKPGAVTHTCNPSYLGGRDQEGSQFKTSQGKKKENLVRPYVNQ
jgi:hypothetical protein